MDRKTIAAAAGLIFSIMISSFFGVYRQYDALTENLLRLHILANSDSIEDQRLKLLVRDELLDHSREFFGDSANREDIIAAAEENLVNIENTAEKVLRENGCNCDVRCELADMYFDERTYGEITVPAGNYTALRVTVGSGGGHNWWCVMYPSLCLPCFSDEELTDEEKSLISENEILTEPEEYHARLFVAEVIKDLLGN